jgi:hypothetical protein
MGGAALPQALRDRPPRPPPRRTRMEGPVPRIANASRHYRSGGEMVEVVVPPGRLPGNWGFALSLPGRAAVCFDWSVFR